jgi:hypothetical protein
MLTQKVGGDNGGEDGCAVAVGSMAGRCPCPAPVCHLPAEGRALGISAYGFDAHSRPKRGDVRPEPLGLEPVMVDERSMGAAGP